MGLKVGDTYLDRGYHSVRSTVLALIGWSDPRRIKDETEICFETYANNLTKEKQLKGEVKQFTLDVTVT